jgi:protein-L-isoaspartate(D-aspartate) O-methyltransferase
MSTLVGSEGKVVTMEIIPELAQKAKALIESHKLKNILMIEGDAGHGYQSEAPYDRIVFTAAAPKMPNFVAEQLKMHGLVLFVKEGRYGTDEVQLLEKTPEGFKCLQKLPCHFVAMTGSATE